MRILRNEKKPLQKVGWGKERTPAFTAPGWPNAGVRKLTPAGTTGANLRRSMPEARGPLARCVTGEPASPCIGRPASAALAALADHLRELVSARTRALACRIERTLPFDDIIPDLCTFSCRPAITRRRKRTCTSAFARLLYYSVYIEELLLAKVCAIQQESPDCGWSRGYRRVCQQPFPQQMCIYHEFCVLTFSCHLLLIAGASSDR